MATGETVKVGVIGLGRSGWGIHCRHLQNDPRFELTAVVDPLPERRAEAIETLGVKRAYATPDELFTDPDIELVQISTPSHTHKPLALAALAAGKHVQVEKPFAVSAAEADEMIAAAKAANRLLTCFQSRRADADFVKVQALLAEERIGRVFHIRMGRYSFQRRADWQTLIQLGGGMLYNWGAHLLDQALLLLGGAYDEVFSDLQRTVGAGDAEDHVKVTLKRDRLVIDVEIFSACALPQPEWLILGERGTIAGNTRQLQVKWYEAGALPPLTADPGAAAGRRYGTGEQIPWREETIDLRQAESTSAVLYGHLYRSIREGAPLFVTPESVRTQLALFDACRAGYTPG